MSKHPEVVDGAIEGEATRILQASEPEVRDYIRRGMMERRLSKVVKSLNALERRQPTRELVRRALQRLGLPTA
jgi:hypothetical protein